MICRADKTIESWEIYNIKEYDSACKGKSALIAAPVRKIRAESSTMLKRISACLFNNFHICWIALNILQ